MSTRYLPSFKRNQLILEQHNQYIPLRKEKKVSDTNRPDEDILENDETNNYSDFISYIQNADGSLTKQVTNDQEKEHITYLSYNPLAKQFGTLPSDNKIHICICNINNNCSLPLLEFAIDKSTKMFPFIIAPNISGNTSAEESHTIIMNECILKLFDLLPFLEWNIMNESFQKDIFKGVINEQTGNIYAVFCFPMGIYKTSENDLVSWKLVDEILYSEDNSAEIDPIVKTMFHEHLYLTEVYEDGQLVPTPFIMYLCNLNGTVYDNVRKENIGILDAKSSHKWFGDSYIFSVKALNGVDKTLLQRYAVFTLYDKYILRDINHVNEEQKNAFFTKYENLDIISIYFHEYSIAFWSIKSPNNFTRLL